MLSKIRSFTLIEMIIVLVIISIMLLITLNISSVQSRELRFRIARENFIANYNSFIIRAITTNSTTLQLILSDDTGVAPLSVAWAGSSSIYFEDVSTIQISSLDGSVGWFTNYTLSFSASQWKCVLTPSGGGAPINDRVVPLKLKYLPNTISDKCYELSLSSCKLKQVTCP